MIQVVKRVFDILEILKVNGSMPLKELAVQAGLQKTTCHNILKSLCDKNIVEIASPGIYEIGEGLRSLCNMPLDDEKIVKRSFNIIERLASDVGETVILGAFRGDSVRILSSAVGGSDVVVRPDSKREGPVYHWATGRVLLAHSWLKTDVTRLISILGMPTEDEWPEIAKTPQALKKELERIRNLDVLIRPADKRGILTMASPIQGRGGEVIAALGMSIPDYRANRGMANQKNMLLQAAEKISIELNS